jgi:hypothetical protein
VVKVLRAPLAVISVVGIAFAAGGSAAAATPPPAPAPVAPANGAGVALPFTISWGAVSDPSGILAYNCQVSATSTFAKVLRADSVMAPTRSDTVSGLGNGTYFWRVQAVSNDFVQSAWSAPRSFSVTGATTGVPGRPTLNQPRGGTSFHPWESFGMSWSAAPRAVKYVCAVRTAAQKISRRRRVAAGRVAADAPARPLRGVPALVDVVQRVAERPGDPDREAC